MASKLNKTLKIDYKKELKAFYTAKANKPTTVQVPVMNYIMIDGRGDPNTSQEYIDAIQTLYPLAYTIKFMSKISYGHDFGVMPLEGLWWAKNMNDFATGDKSNWQWTAMIMQPSVITKEIYTQALEQLKKMKPEIDVSGVRFAPYDEGRAAQVLYTGPYADEGPTIQALHAYIEEQGGTLSDSNKHHHEIYLGDPRRTAPEKLKTIIRQPF